MKIICQDHQRKLQRAAPEGRAVSSVASDVDRLLAPKSVEELETLEGQIKKKLASNEPIDVDYWEQLLQSLTVWKARATLTAIYQSAIASKVDSLRSQQQEEAQNLRLKLQVVLEGVLPRTSKPGKDTHEELLLTDEANLLSPPGRDLDPEPLLKISGEDKGLEVIDESEFLKKVVCYPSTSQINVCSAYLADTKWIFRPPIDKKC